MPSVKGTTSVRYIDYRGTNTSPSIEVIDTYGVNVAWGKQGVSASGWEVDLGSEYELITIVYTRQAGAAAETGSTIVLMNSLGISVKTITLKGNLGREVVDLRVAGNAIIPVYGPATAIIPYFTNMIRARYIRLENPGMPLTRSAANVISLVFSQIAAYDILNRNVVIGKVTSSADGASAGAARAVDGIGESRPPINCYQSVSTVPGSWWEVDLGKEYSLLSLLYYHTDLTATTTLQSSQVALETLTANLPIVLYNSQRQEMKRVFLQKINTDRTNRLQEVQLKSYRYSGQQQVINAGMTIRYIQLVHASNYLQIAQLMAIDNRGMNVAVGKATRTSPVASTVTVVYPPYNAVNGQFNTMYKSVAAGTNITPIWWEVDLGKEYDITSVIYFNSTANSAFATGISVNLYNAQRECVYQSSPLTTAAKQIIDLRPGAPGTPASMGASPTPAPTSPPCDLVPAIGLGILTRYIELKKTGTLGCCQVVALDSLGRNQALNTRYKLNGGDWVTGGALTNGKMTASLTNTTSVSVATTNTILIDLGEEHEIIHVTGYAKPRASAGAVEENPSVAAGAFDTSLSGATVTLYNGCMQQVGQKIFSSESSSWNMAITPKIYGNVLYNCPSTTIFDNERHCAMCGNYPTPAGYTFYRVNIANGTCNSCPSNTTYYDRGNTCIDTTITCSNINTAQFNKTYYDLVNQILYAACESSYYLVNQLTTIVTGTTNKCAPAYSCTDTPTELNLNWNGFLANNQTSNQINKIGVYTKSRSTARLDSKVIAPYSTNPAYMSAVYSDATENNTLSIRACATYAYDIPNNYIILKNNPAGTGGAAKTLDQYGQLPPLYWPYYNVLQAGKYLAATYCETLDFTQFIAPKLYTWVPTAETYPTVATIASIPNVSQTFPVQFVNGVSFFTPLLTSQLLPNASPSKWLRNPNAIQRLGYVTILPFTTSIVDTSSNILYLNTVNQAWDTYISPTASSTECIGLSPAIAEKLTAILLPTNVQTMYYPDSALPIQQKVVMRLRSTTTSSTAMFLVSGCTTTNPLSISLFNIGNTTTANFLMESPTFSFSALNTSSNTSAVANVITAAQSAAASAKTAEITTAMINAITQPVTVIPDFPIPTFFIMQYYNNCVDLAKELDSMVYYDSTHLVYTGVGSTRGAWVFLPGKTSDVYALTLCAYTKSMLTIMCIIANQIISLVNSSEVPTNPTLISVIGELRTAVDNVLTRLSNLLPPNENFARNHLYNPNTSISLMALWNYNSTSLTTNAVIAVAQLLYANYYVQQIDSYTWPPMGGVPTTTYASQRANNIPTLSTALTSLYTEVVNAGWSSTLTSLVSRLKSDFNWQLPYTARKWVPGSLYASTNPSSFRWSNEPIAYQSSINMYTTILRENYMKLSQTSAVISAASAAAAAPVNPRIAESLRIAHTISSATSVNEINTTASSFKIPLSSTSVASSSINSINTVTITGNTGEVSSYITGGTPTSASTSMKSLTTGTPTVGEIYYLDVLTTIPVVNAALLTTVTYTTYYLLAFNTSSTYINPSTTPSAYTSLPRWTLRNSKLLDSYAIQTAPDKLWNLNLQTFYIKPTTHYISPESMAIPLSPGVTAPNTGYSNTITETQKYYYLNGTFLPDVSVPMYALYNWNGTRVAGPNQSLTIRQYYIMQHGGQSPPTTAWAARITIFQQSNTWAVSDSSLGAQGADACYDAAMAANLVGFGNDLNLWTNITSYIKSAMQPNTGFDYTKHYCNSNFYPASFYPLFSMTGTSYNPITQAQVGTSAFQIPTNITTLYTQVSRLYFSAAELFNQLGIQYPTVNVSSLATYTTDVPADLQPSANTLYTNAMALVRQAAAIELTLVYQWGYPSAVDLSTRLVLPFIRALSDPSASYPFQMVANGTVTNYSNMFDCVNKFPIIGTDGDGPPSTVFPRNFTHMVIKYHCAKYIPIDSMNSSIPTQLAKVQCLTSTVIPYPTTSVQRFDNCNPLFYIASYCAFPFQGMINKFKANTPAKTLWGQTLYDFGAFVQNQYYCMNEMSIAINAFQITVAATQGILQKSTWPPMGVNTITTTIDNVILNGGQYDNVRIPLSYPLPQPSTWPPPNSGSTIPIGYSINNTVYLWDTLHTMLNNLPISSKISSMKTVIRNIQTFLSQMPQMGSYGGETTALTSPTFDAFGNLKTMITTNTTDLQNLQTFFSPANYVIYS